LAADVTRFLDGAAVTAHSENVLQRVSRLARRHRVALGIVAAYLLVRAVILMFTAGERNRNRRTMEDVTGACLARKMGADA